MKNVLTIALFFILALMSLTPFVYSADTYTPLAPLPGTNDTNPPVDLPTFLSRLYFFGIGIAIALSVVMIVYGGVQYMSTDAVMKKEDGRETVKKALLGLFLALGSYLIINTVSPGILNTTNFVLNPVGQSVTPPTSQAVTLNTPETVVALPTAADGYFLFFFQKKTENGQFRPPLNLAGQQAPSAQFTDTMGNYNLDASYPTGSVTCTRVAKQPNVNIDPSLYWCARYKDAAGTWCYTATKRTNTSTDRVSSLSSTQVTCGMSDGVGFTSFTECNTDRSEKLTGNYLTDGHDYRPGNCVNNTSVCLPTTKLLSCENGSGN